MRKIKWDKNAAIQFRKAIALLFQVTPVMMTAELLKNPTIHI